MANRISIKWSRYPNTNIFSATCYGISHAQLRHYAQRAGFLDFPDDDSEPVLLGSSSDQHEALVSELKDAGYRIAGIQLRFVLDSAEALQ